MINIPVSQKLPYFKMQIASVDEHTSQMISLPIHSLTHTHSLTLTHTHTSTHSHSLTHTMSCLLSKGQDWRRLGYKESVRISSKQVHRSSMASKHMSIRIQCGWLTEGKEHTHKKDKVCKKHTLLRRYTPSEGRGGGKWRSGLHGEESRSQNELCQKEGLKKST